MCVTFSISDAWDIFNTSICRSCKKGSILKANFDSVKKEDGWFLRIEDALKGTLRIKIKKNGAVEYDEVIFEREEFPIRRFNKVEF